MSIENPTEDKLVTDVYNALKLIDSDISNRNSYINRRDRMLYEDGLFDGLEFRDLQDKTLYNYLRRVVDIHVSQLMSRGVQIYSSYNKEDYEQEPEQAPEPPIEGQEPQEAPDPKAKEELANKKNKLKQVNANTRKKAIDAIIRDNGGKKVFLHGARVGSSYGTTVYKMWLDKKEKRIQIKLLETVQNYYAGFSDSDFRERDWDAYVYQISETQAYKAYGKKLTEDQKFATSVDGQPFTAYVESDRNNALLQTANVTQDTRTSQPMVTVVDFTGILPGWSYKGGKFVEVKRGEEQPFSVMVVGKCPVQVITDDKYMPRYYMIRNLEEPRRAWGKSDICDSAIEINQSLIQVMSTWVTLFHKEGWPTYMAKGFEGTKIPQRKRMATTFLPMSPEQNIELLQQSNAYTSISKTIADELKESLVRVTSISRPMFDDPTINPTSNQVLMTTMKGLIDVVEDKQSRWDPVLIEMFTEALKLSAIAIPELKPAVEDDDWQLYVEWPSVLRREDATYQQMWLNLFNAGVISLETYMEKLGFTDTTEEIDRIRDELTDPTTAAVLGKQIGALAQQVINPPQDPGPDVKVSLRGDLTPYQEANIASKQGFNDGPFPPTAGPQGQGGLASQENADNEGFVEGNPFQGGTPIQRGPDGQPIEDQPNPQLTVDQNQGQTASMPGSGQAPPVTPEGAINQINQRNGA